MIRQLFSRVQGAIDANNPNAQCELYLRDKVSKLQGVLAAFKGRAADVRNYVTRSEVRRGKVEKLNRT